MAYLQVPSGSEEWDVAFFQEIQPKIMSRLDEVEPGLSSRAFECMGEESIFIMFNECCQRHGFEIVRDESGEYWLVRTPCADFAANKIYAMLKLESYNDLVQRKYGTHEDLAYLANRYLSESKGASIAPSGTGEGDNYWRFPDGSCLSLSPTGLKTWDTSVSVDDNDYRDFLSRFATALERGMIEPYQEQGLSV